ncbi:hypothetical protein KAOT1_07183 [Kordia algicida OT-1]|uniref:Uncharacterized protein n=1 Tax=Kordia algicida OT-1 TaxID=391587 RepID=A9DWU9_9FLAO|nr:hypothetical protein [Kordia algicida]EDP95932.1 hypothetical protein KAOT1_07183 [Kordia algicida OT-1]
MLQQIKKVGSVLSKSKQKVILGGKAPGCDQNGDMCCITNSESEYECEVATCRGGSCR